MYEGWGRSDTVVVLGKRGRGPTVGTAWDAKREMLCSPALRASSVGCSEREYLEAQLFSGRWAAGLRAVVYLPRSHYGTGKSRFPFTPSVLGRRVLCAFIRMAGIVRGCLLQ